MNDFKNGMLPVTPEVISKSSFALKNLSKALSYHHETCIKEDDALKAEYNQAVKNLLITLEQFTELNKKITKKVAA